MGRDKIVVIALLLLFCFQPLALKADDVSKLKACDLAITACKSVISAEDAQITTLKTQVSTLESSLVDAQSTPIVPTWLIIVGSVFAGVAAGYTLGHH